MTETPSDLPHSADDAPVEAAEIEFVSDNSRLLPAALFGVAVLLVWRFVGVRLFDEDAGADDWVRIVGGGLLPVAFVTGYPLWILHRHGERVFERRLSTGGVLLEVVIAVAALMGVVFLNITIGVIWQLVSGRQQGMPEQLEQIAFSDDVAQLIVLGVMACLWAPLAEELFFRRFLFRALEGRLRLGTALVIQAALFAVLHDYQGLHILAIFLLGLVLGCLYAWRRTILSSMILHALQNTGAMTLLALLMWLNARAPVLGVQLEDAPQPGARIIAVQEGTAADAAGLRAGDVITHLNPTGGPAAVNVQSATALKLLLLFQSPGDEIELTIHRDGETLTVTATLQARPDD